MSYPDPPGHPEPSQRDVRYGRHRARHADAAPDAYPASGAYRYGDGESAHPLYAGEPPAGPGRRPAAGGPATAPGRGTPTAWPPTPDWPDADRSDRSRPAARPDRPRPAAHGASDRGGPGGGPGSEGRGPAGRRSGFAPEEVPWAGRPTERRAAAGPVGGGPPDDDPPFGGGWTPPPDRPPSRADRLPPVDPGYAADRLPPLDPGYGADRVPAADPPHAGDRAPREDQPYAGDRPYGADRVPPADRPGADGPVDAGPTREVPLVVPVLPGRSRAGRNLPAAIGVGLLLGAVVLVSLFLWRPAFVAVIALAAGIGTWEMTRAVRVPGARPPLVPLLAGCVAMVGLAWFGGPEGLMVALVLTVVAVLIWHLGEGPEGYLRDVSAGTMIAVYVPFLLSFATLLARPDDGQWRVLVTLAAVVLSDTGGYAVGVFLGRHKMAPSISPGKSWEGFAGSLAATATGCALMLYFLFDVPWWHGAVLGVAISAAAVVGDLAESMIKRDLGVKDMSNLLPGHGGLMDRLDSIVLAAPVAYVLLSVLAPVP